MYLCEHSLPKMSKVPITLNKHTHQESNPSSIVLETSQLP
jgi:hypothetical protein